MRSLIILLTIILATAAAGQWEYPSSWRYEDLEKLKEPCVRAWRHEMSKHGRVKMDSALVYCLCYDSADRRFDGVHWTVMNSRRGGVDTLNTSDMHILYGSKGEVIFLADRARMRYANGTDARTTLNVFRDERDVSDSVVRRLSMFITDNRTLWEGQAYAYADSANWTIDSLFHNGPDSLSVISYQRGCSTCEMRIGRAIFSRRPGEPGWSREQGFGASGRTWNVTRDFQEGRLIHRWDSSFADGVGRIMEEAEYVYADSLLVEESHTDWYNAYNEDSDIWSRPDSTTRGPNGDPKRFIRHYTYRGYVLKKIDQWNEQGARVRYSEFEYDDDGLLIPELNSPIVSLSDNGLPLSVKHFVERNAYMLRFEYTSARPAVLPHGHDLDPLMYYEPH